MRRRKFITLLAGTAATWPLAARAQQSGQPVVGFLNFASADGYRPMTAAFRQGLQESGYIEGQNITIEYRWAEGQIDRLPEMAADLVHHQVKLIAATTTPAALAAKAATRTIPIVFETGSNPVELGLVASLNRPGGNVTGVTSLIVEVASKRLELLRELVPGAARVAVFINPKNPAADATVKELEAAAHAMGLQIQALRTSSGREIDAAFEMFARERPDALFVAGDAFFNSRRVQLALLAALHRLPMTCGLRSYVEAGGLMSYGADLRDAYRQVGAYTGRVLKGAKPADLPVVQSTKFELVINAQTARTLGLAVPDNLLATADEVIE
jgi:putative ABC transport system substrate-binding protein